MQSLAYEIMQVTGNVAGCSNAVLGLPREMSAVNTKRCTGCQCSPVLRLPTGQSLQNTEWAPTQQTKRCTGRQCSPVLRLPTGQSLQNSEWY